MSRRTDSPPTPESKIPTGRALTRSQLPVRVAGASGHGPTGLKPRCFLFTVSRSAQRGRFPDLGRRFPVSQCRADIAPIFQQLRIVHMAVAQAVRCLELGEHLNRLTEMIVS